jgi:hypothetical protein
MNSRLAIAIRNSVMLGCLVVVPVCAVVGTGATESPQRSTPRNSSPAARIPVGFPDAPARWKVGDSEAIPTDSGGQRAAAIRPAAFQAAAGWDVPRTNKSGDRLSAALVRLRELGVTYYKLEGSTDGQPRFWFHCRLENDAQPMETTGTDPAGLVEELIRRVERRMAAAHRGV